MLREEEERFLKLAVKIGVLSADSEGEARKLASGRDRGKKPLPFLLLGAGILSNEAVDKVLGAMVDLLDRTVTRADELKRDRQFTKAIQKYSAAIRTNPAHEESFWGRADAFARKACYEDALADYTRLVEMAEERKADAYGRRGSVLARLGRTKEAVADLQRAIELAPGLAQAHFDLGSCQHQLGDQEAALLSYTRAIEHSPDYIEAYNNRAILHLLRRDLDRAQKDWQTCLTIDRNRSTVRKNLKAVLKKIRPSTS